MTNHKATPDSIVAANLRRVLDDRGIKHHKAAEKCGYPEKRFSDMLNGRKIIRDTDVCRISVGLQIPYEELFHEGRFDA